MDRIIGVVEAVREWPITDEKMAHHIEQIRGTKKFFEALQYHFTRRKGAGKPLTVSGVCSYFSEVDRGAFSTEIDAFRARYKGATKNRDRLAHRDNQKERKHSRPGGEMVK